MRSSSQTLPLHGASSRDSTNYDLRAVPPQSIPLLCTRLFARQGLAPHNRQTRHEFASLLFSTVNFIVSWDSLERALTGIRAFGRDRIAHLSVISRPSDRCRCWLSSYRAWQHCNSGLVDTLMPAMKLLSGCTSLRNLRLDMSSCRSYDHHGLLKAIPPGGVMEGAAELQQVLIDHKGYRVEFIWDTPVNKKEFEDLT